MTTLTSMTYCMTALTVTATDAADTQRNTHRELEIMAAGELRPHDGGAFGDRAVDFIKQFNTQYAVLSVGAINAETGYMLHDLQEAALSRLAMSRAQTTIIAVDSSKFGHPGPIQLAECNDIDIVVTDQPVDSNIATLMNDSDVDVVVGAPNA